MKKLLALMLMTMLTATYSWGYVTINVTYNGTANDDFKKALVAIQNDETSTTTDPDNNTVTYKRAYTTASDHNMDDRSDKLKLVITPAAGAPDFDATAVSVLNAYLEDRWPQYREIDLTACTTLTTLITIVALCILGVASIREFALPIIVGILSGVYSANMINGYVWAFLEEKRRSRKAKA